jgi:hypothetical protein
VFWGINITYLDNGTTKISMPDYVKESIAELGESEKSKMLEKTKGEIFHSIVAKLLYVSHRGRLDIQLPIAFLCTRVSCSTEQD